MTDAPGQHRPSGQHRASAKVLMVDPDGSVLLFRGGDPARPEAGSWWFAPGGGVEADETLEQAAAREVFEETGYRVGDLGPVVHRREADFWFNEVFFHTVETYYSVRVDRFVPNADGWTETERSTITEHRWWTAAELRATTDTVYPESLAELIDGDAPARSITPSVTPSIAPSTGLLHDLEFKTALPHAPFSELHTKVIDRPIDEVWPACLETTAKEVRTLGPLMKLRDVPKLLGRGRKVPVGEAKPLIDVFVDNGFVLIRKDEVPVNGRATILFGAVGKFWSPTNNAPLAMSPTELLEFSEPDYAKTIARLEAFEDDNGVTLIETETAIIGTDSASTKKFAPYWALIRLPSGLIRRSWLAAIERRLAGQAT